MLLVYANRGQRRRKQCPFELERRSCGIARVASLSKGIGAAGHEYDRSSSSSSPVAPPAIGVNDGQKLGLPTVCDMTAHLRIGSSMAAYLSERKDRVELLGVKTFNLATTPPPTTCRAPPANA